MMRRAFALAALWWWAAAACAQPQGVRLEAVVTRVSDGDTLWLRIEDPTQPRRKPFKLRLQGIDAPERCQPWGDEATRALRLRVLGRRVQVVLGAWDDYRRRLGNLWLDGEDVSSWLVGQGHAWSYRRHGSDGPYAEQERAARMAQRGLFSQRDPMLPQVFRRWHGACDAPYSGQASPSVQVRGAPGSK